MIVQDYVHFKFPKNRELQFAAMSVAQKYVNHYQKRMKANDVSQGVTEFELIWSIDLPLEDWKFFKAIGTELASPPVVYPDAPDMIVELTEERLAEWQRSGKHATEVFGLLCGEETIPLPHIQRVKPHYQANWGYLANTRVLIPPGDLELIHGEDLIGLQDYKLRGVIGYAGWETYLAASMALPVIEILPPGRDRRWLSKWANRFYRAVVDDGWRPLAQLERAMENVTEQLTLFQAEVLVKDV